MRYARLLEPYKGYWDIQVDEDSEITCCRDEFEFID